VRSAALAVLGSTLMIGAAKPASSAAPEPSSTRVADHATSYFSVPGERRYAWADSRLPFAAGATVAVVHGRSPRSVLHVLAPDAATPIEAPAAVQRWVDRGPYQQERNSIEARSLGNGWTLIVNLLGYRATEYPKLRRLSAHGRAVVVYEDVELNSSFQIARRGHIIRDFAPVDYTRPWLGHPSPAERKIRFGDRRDYHSMAKSLLLVAQLTGLRLTQSSVNSTSQGIAVGVRG
jgi:hypothetical protein